MREIKNWYIKDDGSHEGYMSGLAIPTDADGVTRGINFVNCTFHPASISMFEGCAIDGVAIPDGRQCLYGLEGDAS